MLDRQLRCSRRKFLASAAALSLTGGATAESEPAVPVAAMPERSRQNGDDRKPLAVLTTVWRPLSDSYHLAGRFLHGYRRGGQLHVPRHRVVSAFVEQCPENDLACDLGREFGFRLAPSLRDALVVDGKLAVDGILLIAEHGNYPRNQKGQILYPRFELFGQIVAAFRMTGQSCPLFNDKHLSHDYAKARQMVAWAQELQFPLMAGSGVPVTWRCPELEPELETPFAEGLVAAYGNIEVYGSQALEGLQAMLERRMGGETGVKAVTCLTGKKVWSAGDAGLWSWDLLEAALSRSESANIGDVRRNTGSFAVGNMLPMPPMAFVVEYTDGTRGTILLLNGHNQDFVFAGRIRNERQPVSCLFRMPPQPGARSFDALVCNIEKMLETKQPPYPVERNLLVTGMLAAAMESHHRRGERVETPELDVRYAAPAESGFVRGSVSCEL